MSAFARFGNVSRACDESGAKRRLIYSWRESDPRFAEAFDDARAEAIERLENEAYRRGVEGFEEGTVRKYSDGLLTLLLKANAPDKYRERSSIEHTGKGGGPIAYRPDLTKLTDEELSQLEDLTRKTHNP